MEGTAGVDRRLLERTALKEWAVLVDAMARGDIIALVRKGGIREQRAGFTVRHDRFLLYPTFFHEKSDELAERFRDALAASHAARPPAGVIRLAHVANVMAVWSVSEVERLRGISHEHGLAWPAVESRFRYRDRPGVQVIAVRVSSLPRLVELPEAKRYAGCVSWVELNEDIVLERAVPVLESGILEQRLEAMRAVLGAPRSD